MILGIDEAGRGPVIGPLVLAGVWISRARQHKLVEIGVRDSKAFGSTGRAQQRRRQLAAQIRDFSACTTVLVIDAAEVARRVRVGELNVLEREAAEAIIAAGPPATRIVADGERLFGALDERHPQLLAEDGADATHPVVAAASILAKDERDARFHEIVARFEEELDIGPVRGGGYANKETADFLWAYFRRHGELPPDVRECWSWSVLREIDRVKAGLRPVRPTEQLSLLPPSGGRSEG